MSLDRLLNGVLKNNIKIFIENQAFIKAAIKNEVQNFGNTPSFPLPLPSFKLAAGIAAVHQKQNHEQITFHYETCERGYRTTRLVGCGRY
jgi:hypothetical protein